MGIILGITATRINAPLARWRTHLPRGVPRFLRALWPWSLTAGLLAWLMLFPGASVVSYVYGVDDPNLVLVPLLFALGFLLLTILAGFAYDIEQQAEALSRQELLFTGPG